MIHCYECGALLPMHQTWCKELGQTTVGDPMAQQYTALLRRVKELEAENAALRAERDYWQETARHRGESLTAAERERDTAIKYLAEHLAERSILHDAKAAEFDPEATAFAAGMRRAAEVCQNGGADWAYDLIITDLERLEQ